MRRVGPLLLILIAAAVAVLIAAAPPPEHGRRGMVAADHVLASRAGADTLARGGNAVDAAVAAALAAGVVQPASSGLGGGGFAVVVGADGTRAVLDFREVAPSAATRDLFVTAARPDASTIGGLAVAVPGEPAGLAELHRRFGRLPLRTVARPAIDLARYGFPVGAHLAEAFGALGAEADAFAGALFRGPAPRRGSNVRNVRLGRTIETFARTEGRDLTHGAIARDVALAARSSGGILTTEDLAAYVPKDRAPLLGRYRGWTVVTMPPPSSGGLVLLQALAVLEGSDLRSLGHNSSALLHLYAETLKHGFADRARHLGDPDRVAIPTDRILAADRISAIRSSFDPDHTLASDAYGTKIDAGTDGGTQHISVADGYGMTVALTTTVNTSFGSRVVAAQSGLLLNNEMDDFVARPGEPNAFGLLGSEANSVSPGARPLSSMTPAVLVSQDGTQTIVVGASGGPQIISGVLQVLCNAIDFGMDPSEAVAAPRIHHQWMPDALFVDDGIPEDVVRALAERGHRVERRPAYSSVQMVRVRRTGTDAEFEGASDPRKGGWPAAP